MAACLSCAEELPAKARFCPNCGLPTSPAEGRRIEFGPQAQVVTEEFGLLRQPSVASRRSPRAGRTRTLVAVLSAFGAVFIAWLIFRSPAPEVEESGVDQDPAAPTSVEEESDEAADAAESGEVATSTTAEGVDSTETDTSVSETPVRVEPIQGTGGGVLGEPFLIGREVGLRLVAATGDRLITIDLDSGDLGEFAVEGEPVGVVGNEIVVFDDRQGFVAVSLDSPQTDRRVVFSVPEIEAAESRVSVTNLWGATIREPDTLIAEFGIGDEDPNEPSLVFEIDVFTGSFGATEVEVGHGAPPWLGRSRFGLVWVPGGGVFETDGGVYRQLADGFPLLMGLNYIIVGDCPEPAECRQYWVERGEGNRIERALPDLEDVFWITEVDAEARILSVVGHERRGYFDVERNRWLPAPEPRGFGGDDFFGSGAEALSADGRWFATPAGGDVVLHDLDTDERYRIDPTPSLRNGRLFLVAKEPA